MSTRRAVRPDSQVYRQTRRLGGRRRRPGVMLAVSVCLAIVLFTVIVLFWIARHH